MKSMLFDSHACYYNLKVCIDLFEKNIVRKGKKLFTGGRTEEQF